MKCFALLTLVCVGSACGQGLTTRQQAVDGIDNAVDDKAAWVDWVEATDDEINAVPDGPTKDAILVEWTDFVVPWGQPDTAAASHIDTAEEKLADGDAEPSPMLKGLYYAQSLSWSILAQNQLADLMDDYDVFVAASGWTPSTSPPN